MIARRTWSELLTTAGGIALAVGAINPLGGALAILAGSASIALGTHLASASRRIVAYRTAVFLLVAFGVAAVTVLTLSGGFGGDSGRSNWWGLLILPILIGWSMGICGPGSPRWLLLLGIAVSLWYLAIAAIVLSHPNRAVGELPALALAATALFTIAGAILRLAKRAATKPAPSPTEQTGLEPRR